MTTALEHQSEHYPKHWQGKVPKRVRMLQNVTVDLPFMASPSCEVIEGCEYEVSVNTHGAVSAITQNGKLPGLKPSEFEVIEWHKPMSANPCPPSENYLEKIIRARLKQHRENLQLWESGYLKPTEPDAADRALTMFKLALVIDELESLLAEAGYDV
jgi:hypothetical protein